MALPNMLKRDETILVLVSLVISVASFLFFYAQGTTLGYKDMYSHLEIGRRLIVGQSTGFGQLGGIWLPLQHILMIPLVWNDFLYTTGLAGSLLSMASFVASVVLVFKIIHDLSGSRIGGYAAAALFGLNPNMLYLQSTPMTEPLMYVSALLSVWGILRWLQTDRYSYLLMASFATFSLTLTRYEGWILAVVFIVVVVYGCIRKRYPLFTGNQKGQGLVLAFTFFAMLGVVGWNLWNQLIFNNWLNWMQGEYSSSDQVSTQVLSQVNDLSASVMTYWYAVIENVPVVFLAIGAVGLLVLVVREKLSPESVTIISLLSVMAFLVYGLYKGQQPMHVEQIDGDLYNLRFGTYAVLPVSLLIGYLVAMTPRRWAIRSATSSIVGASATVFLVLAFANNGAGVITNREAWSAMAGMAEQKEVAQFLKDDTRGRILMESFNNERALFDVQSRVIYEGAEFLWDSSLIDPTGERNKIDVIVMRTMPGNTDKVYDSMHDAPVLYEYQQVFASDNYLVYEKKGELFSE